MGKWLKLDCLTANHPKMLAAGPWGMAVTKAAWELARAHDCNDGEITRFWNVYHLSRQTLLDQMGQAGHLLTMVGMYRAVQSGLIETKTRPGPKKNSKADHKTLENAIQLISSQLYTLFNDQLTPQLDLIQINSNYFELFQNFWDRFDALFIHNWNLFQNSGKPDFTATERKRRERQRKKESAEKNVTPDQSVTCHASHKRDNVTCHAVEKSRIEYINNIHIPPAIYDHCLTISTHLNELIATAHPTAKLQPAEKYCELAYDQHKLGVDLALAVKVATWAFHHDEWTNGWSWVKTIRSHQKFWAKYQTLEDQYVGLKNRKPKPKKGQRVKSMRGKSRLTVIDFPDDLEGANDE
jgi:hypothetical protein